MLGEPRIIHGETRRFCSGISTAKYSKDAYCIPSLLLRSLAVL
uniref:Uncharacterized protein n=1 Tax=Anguilla anguilla TaxID=7936 RepID=A0A0E9SXC9_ANGAN